MAITGAVLVPHPPLIVPGVGRGREEEVRETIDGFQRAVARLAETRPDTVVIFTPHATLYADYIHIAPGEEASGSLARFGDPQPVRVRYDRELAERLEALCAAENLPGGTLGEKSPELDHGALVPLHFLRQALADLPVVRIAPSGLSRREHYRFGTLLARAAEELGRRVAVVASGDLSHKLREDGPYGFAPEGPRLDRAITGAVERADFAALLELDETLCRRGAECGLLPLIMLAGTLDGRAVRAELYSYQAVTGVGYATAFLESGEADPARRYLEAMDQAMERELLASRTGEDPFVALARFTLEAHVRTGRTPPLPENLPEALTGRRAGVFVTLKQHGELRGCIGTIAPTTPSIAEEIRQNAVSSGTRDPRFPPVEAHELAELRYSVDVLGDPEPALTSQLDPSRYGVIVSRDHRRGLLLPMLEGIDTVEEQLEVALRKAGISPGESYSIERFEVRRHT